VKKRGKKMKKMRNFLGFAGLVLAMALSVAFLSLTGCDSGTTAIIGALPGISPTLAIQLTEGVWADGTLASGGEQWFKFTATADTQYIHFDSGTLPVMAVQLYDAAEAPVGETRSLALGPVSQAVTIGYEYYIKTTASTYSGTYKIAFNKVSTPPVITIPVPTTGITALTADTWADGNIDSSDGQWFQFTATAATQFIHFKADTLIMGYVQLYTVSGTTGTTVGGKTLMNILTPSISQAVTTGTTYYIRVTQPTSEYSGTYKIGFTTLPVTPGTTATTLSAADTWADGNIAASGGEQWFQFTATAATQFIHFKPGTLTSVLVHLYDNTGTVEGMASMSDFSGRFISRAVTSGATYYIRVTPPNSGGNYQIGFTASLLPPGTTATTLSAADTWADGNIAASEDEQWFEFTATAATQFIHFKTGTLDYVYVQLYDSTGTAFGSSYASPPISQAVTIGNTYYIKVTLPSSSSASGNYQIAFNTSILPPGTTATTLSAANTWSNGNITTSGDEQWFKFTATAATQFIHFKTGTLTSGIVSLYDSTGTPVGNSYDSTFPVSRSVTSGATYYIRVTTYSTYSGTYQIAFNTSLLPPGTVVTTLSANKLVDGNIASGGEQWFKFTATADTQYIHFAPGTLSTVSVQLYDAAGTVGTSTSLYSSSTSTSRTVTSGNEYYIKVKPPSYGSSSGSYQIGFNTSSTAPSIITLPATPTNLTANAWANGNITTSGGTQWFSFTATAATHYIHFNPGTLTDVNVELYDDAGTAVGTTTNLSGSTPSTSKAVTSGKTYYIKVTLPAYRSGGTYKITFNTTLLPPNTTATTLSAANTWSNGNITTSGGEQWFSFTATAANQYIHFNPGTLNVVYVQLYANTGTAVGTQVSFWGSALSLQRTVTNGNEYYIRVTPPSSGDSSTSGTYKIAFNDSTTPPAITVPTTDITTLTTANTWADGTIDTSGNEQWFKFTAFVTGNQYIHFDPGTLNYVYVQLYTNTGAAVGNRASFSYTLASIYQAVTNGNEYYIRVKPYTSDGSGSGTYKIAFNASSTPPVITVPTTGVTELTANTWTDDTTASGGEQWFKFTATDTTQYIHFNPGTLSGVSVQLYTSDGAAVGNRASLYSSNRSVSQTVTSGSVYYIRVMTTGSGTYKIVFNTSSTAPSL